MSVSAECATFTENVKLTVDPGTGLEGAEGK
jgi:hypothetical protein